MIPQKILPEWRAEFMAGNNEPLCSFAQKWGIHLSLALRLATLAAALPFEIRIISGARSKEKQDELEREGYQTAPYELSTHASTGTNGCPRWATGADIEPVGATTRAMIATLGGEVTFQGLRWGGGAPVDSEGIPVGNEWRHVDLGPRGQERSLKWEAPIEYGPGRNPLQTAP